MPKPTTPTPATEATPTPTSAPTPASDTTDQPNTNEQVQQLTTERDELTQQINALKTTALNKYLEDNSYAVRTNIMQRLGHDPNSIVNPDLSIDTDKLNAIMQSIKADGFVIEQQDTNLERLIESKGLRDPKHVELLRDIKDTNTRNKVATALANESKWRVNSRVGQGGGGIPMSSLETGAELYEANKRDRQARTRLTD